MARFVAVSAIAVLAVVALAIIGPWHNESEALGPDINNDGVVDLPNDILGVILSHLEPPPIEFTIKPRPMRLIFEEEVSVSSGSPTVSSIVDTSECNEFTAMLEQGPGITSRARFADGLASDGNIRTSPDGSRTIPASVLSTNQDGDRSASMSFSGSYPYLGLVIDGATASVNVDVWLFCR